MKEKVKVKLIANDIHIFVQPVKNRVKIEDFE